MTTRPRITSRVPGGEALFQRMFTRIGCEERPPHFHVEFYPYSSLVLTIRRRGDSFFVRFSDLTSAARHWTFWKVPPLFCSLAFTVAALRARS